MVIALLGLGFAVVSVRCAVFLVRDANRQAREHTHGMRPEAIVLASREGSVGDWTALDEYQLNRLLKEAS